MKLYPVIALLAALASVSARAEKVWGDFIAGGTACNNNNVSVIENGNNLSVLFDNFGVNMPQQDFGDGLSARKTCTFRISMTPPKGFYLAGFDQVYSGGLIKSRNSSAQLNIRYNIGSVVGQPLPIVWRNGTTIRPEDPSSLFQKSYHNDLLIVACGGSTIYGLNMSMTATRSNDFSEHVVGGLDSVDATLTRRLDLIPVWRVCPR